MKQRRIWDGAKLISLMAFRGVSTGGLAEQIETTAQTLSTWRRGVEPPEDLRPPLAHALACAVADFYSVVQ